MSALVRLYRIALLSFRPERRHRFGDEMIACFQAGYDARLRKGRGAALAFAARAIVDTLASGIRDRIWLQRHAAQSAGRRDGLMSVIGADAAYATRSLRRKWRFSAGVALSLAVGLGLSVPVLGLADYFFVRTPEGVRDADNVVRLVMRGDRSTGPYFTDGLTGLDYNILRTRARTLEGVAAWMPLQQGLGTGTEARIVSTTLTSASYASVLGLKLTAGRWFSDGEDIEGVTQAPCVISYNFWKTSLGGSSAAIGHRMLIGGVEYVVVGIAPAGFTGLNFNSVDVWLPIHTAAPAFQGHDPELWTTDHSSWLRIVARVKPGISKEASAAEAALLYRTGGIRTRDPQMKGTYLWDPLPPGRSRMSDRNARIALWLSAGGALLLLLVVANLVNLSLSRAVGDARQTAVRLAIGGSWTQLFRPMVVESVMLSAAASAVGLIIAYPAMRMVRVLLLPRVTWTSPPLDLRIGGLAFAIALCIGSALAIWTTFHMMRVSPSLLLRSAGADRSRGTSSHALRRALLTAQAMIFFVLLTGASAFVTSLHRAATVSFGFAADSVIAARIPREAEAPKSETRQIYSDAVNRLSAMPDIEAVTLAYMEPGANNTYQKIEIPGREVEQQNAFFDIATPDYLRVFGLNMYAGRWIQSSDKSSSEPVVVVNEAFARAVWPGGDALGKCMRVGEGVQPCRTVVGIVRNMFVTGRTDDPPTPIYYVPVTQADAYAQTPILFFRPRGPAAAATASVRRTIQQLRSDLPAVDIHPVSENFDWMTAPLRLGAAAFTAFGILAAIIASIGLHSMASFVVTEQRRASAIRIAIGARPAAVSKPILVQAVVTVAIGLIGGLALLVPLSHVLEPILFHTRLLEVRTMIGIATLGILVCIAATAAPMRTLRRTDVMNVLREE